MFNLELPYDVTLHIPAYNLEAIMGLETYNFLSHVEDYKDVYERFDSTSNLLSECFPFLYAEIHPFFNKLIDIENITIGSTKIIYWICSRPSCTCKIHHVYSLSVQLRTSGQGCRYCNKLCKCNSMFMRYPNFLREYDWENNDGINPYALTYSNHTQLNWVCTTATCSCIKHNYTAKLNNRTTNKSNCPFCCHQKTCPCNSLLIRFPHIAIEFDKELNNNINPINVAYGSSCTNYWWKCSKCSNTWKTTVNSRTWGSGCPHCNSSQLEKSCAAILKDLNIDFEQFKTFPDCKDKSYLFYDFFLPNKNALIELDGKQHFDPNSLLNNFDFSTTRRHDIIKNDYPLSKKINLLRISFSQHIYMKSILIKFIQDIETGYVIRFVGPQYKDISWFFENQIKLEENQTNNWEIVS